jgi:putative ABC transport system permease protein
MQARLTETSAPYDVLDTDDFVKSIRMIGIVRSVANTITIIMLLLTLMIVANTMLMSVNERTYEFGVLAALGWTPRRIMGLVLSEGFALTVTGGLAGLALGAAFMATASMVSQQAYLSPSFTASMIAQIIAAVIVAGIAGALYPARKAVQMNAVEALRKA